MLDNREGNRTGEGLKCKNKWERHENVSKMQVEKKKVWGENGINFNNWNEIPEAAFMGSREQMEKSESEFDTPIIRRERS